MSNRASCFWAVTWAATASVLSSGSSATLLPVTALYTAEYSWAASPLAPATLCTSAPGAVLRAVVTGTTTLSLALDVSSTSNASAAQPEVAWSVDALQWQSALVGGQPEVLLATGLDASAAHTVLVVLDASSEAGDRWLFRPTNQFLCVQGLAVDAGGAALPPALRPRRSTATSPHAHRQVLPRGPPLTTLVCHGPLPSLQQCWSLVTASPRGPTPCEDLPACPCPRLGSAA